MLTVLNFGIYTVSVSNEIEFSFLPILGIIMDTLPVELVTIIATDTFELFTTLLLVPTIGHRLCTEYPQLIAREKFISTKTTDNKIYSLLNNKKHSFDDQPAVIYKPADTKYWYKYSKRHRENKPAVEYACGDKEWWMNGQHHRCDQPAVIYASGDKEWYQHGKLHRENDLPAVENISGTKCWYWNGERHRRDQPAIEWSNGDKEWFWYGKHHRENDLPAVERVYGAKYWYWNGKLHRGGDLPAIEWTDGTKCWYINGECIKRN